MQVGNNFKSTPMSNNFYSPNIINTKQNILYGPGFRNVWNHSEGNKKPMEKEEGPLPIQGNIGAILKEEVTNYSKCTGTNQINNSPNCTNAFTPDAYTLTNTCRDCELKYPEYIGMKDFAMENVPNKYTNAHGIHATENKRAGATGQSNQTGCYSFIPNVSNSGGSVCSFNPDPKFTTVGDWSKLGQYKNLMSSSFKKL